jgi:predicted PurR-regulated permease PerM
MEEVYFKRITSAIILGVLILISFFMLRPILLSIFLGFILAYIFTPSFKFLNKYTKSKTFSSVIISLMLVFFIILFFWYLIPPLISQSVRIYIASQQMDFINILENFFPGFFESPEFSSQVSNTLNSFITKTTGSLMTSIANLITNIPTLSLQLLVVAFTFFFALRDQDEIIAYIKSIIPFSKEVEKKLFDYTKGITSSVIYGQVVIGFIQGIIVGIGLLIFRVPNALILGLIAIFASILPILGPFLVWVPVVIYLLVGGNNVSAWGVGIFGIISSTVDNILRPFIVSKKTQLHSGIVLIGMIGGLFFFGILGLILGPLILAYLFIILELYRNNKLSIFLVTKKEGKN